MAEYLDREGLNYLWNKIVDRIEQASGGNGEGPSSCPDVMIVNATGTDRNVTIDKTRTEIITAFDNGKIVLCKYAYDGSKNCIMNCSRADYNEILFEVSYPELGITRSISIKENDNEPIRLWLEECNRCIDALNAAMTVTTDAYSTTALSQVWSCPDAIVPKIGLEIHGELIARSPGVNGLIGFNIEYNQSSVQLLPKDLGDYTIYIALNYNGHEFGAMAMPALTDFDVSVALGYAEYNGRGVEYYDVRGEYVAVAKETVAGKVNSYNIPCRIMTVVNDTYDGYLVKSVHLPSNVWSYLYRAVRDNYQKITVTMDIYLDGTSVGEGSNVALGLSVVLMPVGLMYDSDDEGVAGAERNWLEIRFISIMSLDNEFTPLVFEMSLSATGGAWCELKVSPLIGESNLVTVDENLKCFDDMEAI